MKRVIYEHDQIIRDLRNKEDLLLDSELSLKTQLKGHDEREKSLQCKVQEMEKYISNQLSVIENESKAEVEQVQVKLHDFKDREAELEEQLTRKQKREDYLLSKVDILEQTEDTLMDQIMVLVCINRQHFLCFPLGWRCM